MRWVLLGLVLLYALAAPAFATPDVAAANEGDSSGHCNMFTMCVAQTATGNCVKGSAAIVADVQGYIMFVMYSDTSTATSHTCHLLTSSKDSTTMSSTPAMPTGVTNLVTWDSYYGPLKKVMVNCSALTAGAGSVNVKLLACRP